MSKPRLLLVGEGDFSYAAALATKRTHTVVATALMINEKPTKRQLQNIKEITENGGFVFLNVDATKLSSHPEISAMHFQQIQFNFPHVGGKMNIKANRQMVHRFFQSCRKLMDLGCFSPTDGKVCVALCSGQGGTPADTKHRRWHDTWQVVPLAASAEFVLTQVEPFILSEFPGYRCTGYRSLDKGFQVEGARLHIFQHEPAFCCPPSQLLSNTLTKNIEIQGNIFQVPSFYVEYLERNHLEEDGSPIQRTYRLAEKHTYLLGFTKIADVDSVVCVLEMNKQFQNFSEKLVKLSRLGDEGKWTLLPSLVSALNDETLGLLQQPSFRVGRAFLQASVSAKVPPVANQMWLHWKSSFNFSPVKFMENMIPAPKIDMISFEDNSSYTVEDDYLLFAIQQITSHFGNQEVSVSVLVALCRDSIENQEVGVVFKSKSTSHMCVSLDNITMVRYQIQNWRIMWTRNGSYSVGCEMTSAENTVEMFRTKSLFPASYQHDVSFWLPPDNLFNENDFVCILRCKLNRGLENICLLEEYACPKTGKKSRCYRLIYRSWEGSLSKEGCSKIHQFVCSVLVDQLNVVLR